VYKYANPMIAENQKKETEQAIFRIFTDGKKYDKMDIKDETVFKVTDESGKTLGYAFMAEGNGYQGVISMMAGIETDMETLVGIEILESQETPGLGQEIAGESFKAQFKGLKTTPEITYVKNQKPSKSGEIEAITGATISSRAVVSILNEKIKSLKEKLGKGE